MVLHLLGALNTSMNCVTAALVVDAVRFMAYKMPHLVPVALKLLDDRLVRLESTIETLIHTQNGTFVSGRDELIGRQTTTGDQSKPEAVKPVASADSADLTAADVAAESASGEIWGTDPAGNSILPSKQQGNRTAQVDIKVVQIANLIGPPEHSPFEAVVENCNFAVCESKIMKAAIDFKWQRIRWWVCADLAYYTISLVVASAAMLDSAWTAHNVFDVELSASSKTLFVVMIVLEALLLMLEMAQMIVHRHRWMKLYNVINVASILLLLTPSTVYLAAHRLHIGDIAWQRFSVTLMQNLGSMGLGLKWLGVLDYLDSFQCKSPSH
jgi:hypothetical protein